jgi:hypothetical protein
MTGEPSVARVLTRMTETSVLEKIFCLRAGAAEDSARKAPLQ